MSAFSTGTDTLYGWTPTSTGQYSGACLFLFVLAAISRFLIAFRSILNRQREQVTGGSGPSLMVLKDGEVAEDVVVHRTTIGAKPWTATFGVLSAAISTVLAGALYLL